MGDLGMLESMNSITEINPIPQPGWQTCRLDRLLGLVRLDQVPVGVKVDGQVESHPMGVASAVLLDGTQRLVGMWPAGPDCDEATMWDRLLGLVCARGAQDVFVVSCSQQRALSTAAQAAWPQAFVDVTVVPLLRDAMTLTTWAHRRQVIPMLRQVLTAPDELIMEAGIDALEATWGHRYPAVVARCRSHADGLRALTGLDPALRRVMASDNGIAEFERTLRGIARHGVLTGETDEVKKLVAAAGVGFLGQLSKSTVGWNQAMNALALTQANRLDLAR